MTTTRLITSLILLSPLSLCAQDALREVKAVKEVKEPKPTIEKIDEDNFRIGKIKLNKKTKEITFDATLGEPDSIIEYLLVNDNGKIHEALFITEIQAINLNLALKLIGYKESKHLFRVLDKDFVPTDKFHEEAEETKSKSKFDLFVSWQDGEKVKEVHVNELILNAVSKKHAKVQPYVYGGSYLLEGRFKAQLSGDIIAIFTDRGAVANFSNEGREDDTQWFANQKRLPGKNVPITLVIKKHEELK